MAIEQPAAAGCDGLIIASLSKRQRFACRPQALCTDPQLYGPGISL